MEVVVMRRDGEGCRPGPFRLAPNRKLAVLFLSPDSVCHPALHYMPLNTDGFGQELIKKPSLDLHAVAE